ncbi:glycosyltransferase [Photobacterium swingsii]|uniref:glycosyltransferase family 2 protein n=1 Tax=Photobacterium swingsii TaxID=680026 RepID=UPI003D0B13FA
MIQVDVLIPMYNAEKTINESVLSVLNQTIKANIIICDDASTDNSLFLVKQLSETYDNISIVENVENLGYLKTFNKLLTCSSSDFIAFLDADDYYLPEKLEKQLAFLHDNTSIDVVGCNYTRVDNNNKYTLTPSNLPLEHSKIFSSLINGDDVICGSSLMVRREVISNIGGYREFFEGKVGEDIDWFTRIIQRHRVANVSYTGYSYRMSLLSLTRKVSYNVRDIHVHDFINFLFRYRVENNVYLDCIDNNQVAIIDDFFEAYELLYEKTPCLLYTKTAFNHALNGDYSDMLKDITRCFSSNFKPLLVFKSLILVTIVCIFPQGMLLKLKEAAKIKNITRNLLK